MRHTCLLATFLTALPIQKVCAQDVWDRVFDGGQPLVINRDAALPAPASDVELSGPRVTLLLNADQSDQRDPVWPGYSIFAQPILLYEAGIRSFLLAHPNPPAGYSAVFSFPRTVFVRPGPLSDLNFNFQFHRQVNDIDTFAYRYRAGDKPERDVRTMIHERFHVHQERGFSAFTYNQRDSEPDGEDLGLAALEQRTLKSALQAGAPGDSARFARQFLAVRAERYARQPDSRDHEADEERSEGMAEYVEETLINRREVAPAPGGVISGIAERLDRFPTIDEMAKARYYGTGAAQGLLLDRAGSADWKKRVAAGASLSDVLALAYPISADSGLLLAEAKSAHGYDALLRMGTQLAGDYQALKAGAISDYDNAPGIEWTVPVPWDKDTDFGYSGGSPEFKLSKTETLMPHLMLLDVTSTAFKLHFTDRPAILGSGVRFRAAASAAVFLDGRPFTVSEGVYPFSTLSMAEEGLELSVSKPGMLTVTGRKAVISYRGKNRSTRSLLGNGS